MISSTFAVEKLTIQWHGIEGELLDNAKQYVSLAQEPPEKLTPERIKYLYQVAAEGITWSVRPFGYYNPKIRSQLTEPTQQNPAWQVSFNITLNEPVKVQSVDIIIHGEAQEDKKFQQFIGSFPLKIGDTLHHPSYEKGKRALEELALEQGYLDAKLSRHEVKVYKKSDQATISIELHSGPRYCIDHVVFRQSQFSDKLLKRYVPFRDGEPYTRDKLLGLRHALIDSGFFRKLDIQQVRMTEKKKHCVYLEITPQLKDQDTYRGRIGYGTDTGVRVGVDARFNYLNRFGHSVQGSLGYTVKKKRHLARANYFIPVGKNTETFWKLSFGYKAEDFSSDDLNIDGVDGLTRVKDFSLSLGWHQPRRFFNGLKLDEVVSVEYLSENYDLIPLLFPPDDQKLLKLIAADPELAGELFPKEGLDVLIPELKVLSFGLNWSYQNTDNRIYTNRGYRLDWGIKGASKNLGSDINYWQTRLKSKFIYRLSRKNRLLFRSDMAYTDAEVVSFFDTQINQVPKELLFATGGDNSIRGYEFEELNGGDTLPRARNLLVGSVEYEHEVYPNWSLAAFYDVGNAFNKFSSFKAKTGIGLGVRWHSPIGMVRLDVAHAKDRDGGPLRLHFTIGPDF